MKCNSCDAEAGVLETRTLGEFFIVRRHRCTRGHTFKTVQMLHTVTHGQRQWLESAQQRALRGVERRRREHAMRERVAEMLRAGEKWAVIQLTLGVSEGLVKKVSKECK